MISLWKMILLLFVFAIGNFFPSALGMILDSGMTNIELAMYNLKEQNQLYWLLLGVLFFNAVAANLGM